MLVNLLGILNAFVGGVSFESLSANIFFSGNFLNSISTLSTVAHLLISVKAFVWDC